MSCSLIRGAGMVLVDARTGDPICAGSERLAGKTGRVVVTGGEPPLHRGSTGRVRVVERLSGLTREYFPSVVGAEWIEEH